MSKHFAHFKQFDSTDCGAACLKIIAKNYGKTYSLSHLRDLCHISREGVSLLGISDAAEAIGLDPTGFKVSFEQFCDEISFPCIIHWDQRHFVVVYKVKHRNKNTCIYVSDPAIGLVRYEAEEFKRHWIETEEKGIVLTLEPTEMFYSLQDDSKNIKHTFKSVIEYLSPHKCKIALILVAMVLSSGIAMLMPFLSQAIIDKGIGGKDVGLVALILIAQTALVLGQLFTDIIRNRLMLLTSLRVSISLISDFLFKLMMLPISFFDSRKTGDILQRIGDHKRIQNFLTGSLIGIIISSLSLIVYTIVVGFYSLKILCVFVVGSALYILWVLVFFRKRRYLDYLRFRASASNQSNLIQIISGMQEIKLNNCENAKREQWESIQENLYNINVKSLQLSQTQQLGATFIDQAKNILISFISASAVISEDLTLGMMTAIQFIIGQLNAPVAQFLLFAREAQDANISFERLNEINDYNKEGPLDKEHIKEIPENATIEFRNVSFQYDGPHSRKVLDDVNINIPAGKVTAIVGASGSGKTTLLKLILGFYPPTEGKILLGGEPIENYCPKTWRSECGVVMQDGYIFSDSIEDNISIGNEHCDKTKVKEAARIANIDDFIESLPLRYETQIGSDGCGLSVGQKQRILIARAACKNSRYLIFDEATNSLDTGNETAIMKNLTTLFHKKTVITAAHRLSTVKNADNIIVLDNGKVVEQGTHKELSEKKGYYFRLVRNQLELGS